GPSFDWFGDPVEFGDDATASAEVTRHHVSAIATTTARIRMGGVPAVSLKITIKGYDGATYLGQVAKTFTTSDPAGVFGTDLVIGAFPNRSTRVEVEAQYRLSGEDFDRGFGTGGDVLIDEDGVVSYH
ncbi:MAG TPA: hypothetical protein PLV68_04555, partial [Ilumatobacteraceae bacterium]|nr:hypothetical protein [Ilumatobacteraceae bacterium]